MKYTPVIFAAVTALAAGLVFVTPVNAAAGDAPTCGILPQSICDADKNNTTGEVSRSGVMQLIVWVLRIMTGLVGVAAIGATVYAAILYSSASSSSEQVNKAKTIITDMAIGVISYGLMFLALNWLIPGGVFG